MLGLDEPVFHALVGFVIGVVLTLLIILLVDFLYRKAIFTAQARITSRLELARRVELDKLAELEKAPQTQSVTKDKPEIIKTEPESQVRELDLDAPVDESEDGEPSAIYPPGGEETDEAPAVEEYRYFVKGNPEPFGTLRDALQVFPIEAKKDIENPVWDDQPKYVRDNIRREEV